jgi:periplasmic protein TonB
MSKALQDLKYERFGAPMASSVALHVGIVGAIALAIFLAGRFHGDEWGNNAPPGAIQATLVSSAPTIPLPQDTPPTKNVLATDTPSPAPAPPAPKARTIPPPDAIPIPVKRPPPPKIEKKPHVASPKTAQTVPQQHRANYGEARATQIPHATVGNPSPNNAVSVNGGDFASRFPYYVNLITQKVSAAWYRQEIDPRTPYGSKVSVTFTISRDGSVSSISIDQPSGSPTLNSSATRAVERVDTFGPLPSAYHGSTVSVEYTFTYSQPSQ